MMPTSILHHLGRVLRWGIADRLAVEAALQGLFASGHLPRWEEDVDVECALVSALPVGPTRSLARHREVMECMIEALALLRLPPQDEPGGDRDRVDLLIEQIKDVILPLDERARREGWCIPPGFVPELDVTTDVLAWTGAADWWLPEWRKEINNESTP